MQYCSHYIWESGSEEEENQISLVLQQAVLRNHHYLLACVCDGEKSGCSGKLVSGYFTERLVEWFHHHGLKFQKSRRGTEGIGRSLYQELMRVDAELREYAARKQTGAEYDVRGIFLCDNQFWLFGQGECRGYQFNRRFYKKQRKNLPGGNEIKMEIIHGQIQKNIGILLCSKSFAEKVTGEEMVQVLFEEPLEDREIQRRLRELWKESVDRGVRKATGAVFIRVD